MPLRREDVTAVALAVGAGATVGLAVHWSLQAAIALVVVGLLVALHGQRRGAALLGLWFLWLLAPMARRIIDWADPARAGDIDLLSIAPFAATAALGLLEFVRTPVSRRGRRVLLLAGAGLAIGLPAAVADPLPMTFATLAYGSALLAFVIGYADLRRGGRLSLERALLLIVPGLAAYALYQWFFPLPAWDVYWTENEPLRSLGTKEGGDFRVFSTLNSPGTLAYVLAAACGLVLAMRRLTPYRALVFALAATALSLTFLRSAWIALLPMLVVVVVGSRFRLAPRVAIITGGVIALVLATAGSPQLGGAVIDRFDTFGELGTDVSANAREAAVRANLPIALRQPIGAGLGSVGEARRLSQRGEAPFLDNGWLNTLFQIGPAGFLLIVAAIGAALAGARGPRRPGAPSAVLLLAPVATLLTLHLSSDILFGIPGAILWYCLGAIVALREPLVAAAPRAAPVRPPAAPALPAGRLPAPVA